MSIQSDHEHRILQEVLDANRIQQAAIQRQLIESHLASVREIMGNFTPKKLYQTFRIDGLTYIQPVTFQLPNAVIGGIYVRNPTASIVRVFLGQDATAKSEFDLAANHFFRWPLNHYAGVSLVTFTLSAPSAGVIRIVLSTESMDPDEGSLV